MCYAENFTPSSVVEIPLKITALPCLTLTCSRAQRVCVHAGASVVREKEARRKIWAKFPPAFRDAEEHDLIPWHRQLSKAEAHRTHTERAYCDVETFKRSRVAQLTVCKPQGTRLTRGPRSAWARFGGGMRTLRCALYTVSGLVMTSCRTAILGPQGE